MIRHSRSPKLGWALLGGGVACCLLCLFLVKSRRLVVTSNTAPSLDLLLLSDQENAGYRKWLQFKPVPGTRTLPHRYITLWLHQVHAWFGVEDGPVRYQRIRAFLQDAKTAGFTAVMGDVPWEWTERDVAGNIDLQSWNKDWMKMACDMGLQLQIVISMRELPPWLLKQTTSDAVADYFEQGSPACAQPQPIQTPSAAHEHVWKLMLQYTQQVTKALLQQYGTCIIAISPTLNNEFETRYSQTSAAMRDYSAAAVARYKEWQVQHGWAANVEAAPEPFVVPCAAVCDELHGDQVWRWLEFREEFLANRYIALCQAVQDTSRQTLGNSHSAVGCLLHIGEMLATTDVLNANLFFRLARSTAVDELVMDSNCMLSGAPASPSVVGLMISTAQVYTNKTIHYEVATERVMPCGPDGTLVSEPNATTNQNDQGARLLLRTGVTHALQAAIDSLGVTNLCQPALAATVLPFDSSGSSSMLKRSGPFHPTALIFVPYRAFLSFSFMTTGLHCGRSAVPCWHTSLANLPFFGKAGHIRQTIGIPVGTCPVDAMQYEVLHVWDDLRLRHEHVAVVGDVSILDETNQQFLDISERVVVRFPCLMNELGWHFFNGEQDRRVFEAFRAKYPFAEHVAHNVC